MLQRIRKRKGFTLVELMIVVSIIGILAAIAIPNFLNFRLKAKTSEAKSNLGAIRSTEVAYVAENDEYVAGQPTTPVDRGSVANPQDKKPRVNTTRFSILGFAPEGEVFFSYLIQDGTGADPLWPTAVEGFVVQAIGDLDGDGQLSDFTVTNTSTEVTKGGAPF